MNPANPVNPVSKVLRAWTGKKWEEPDGAEMRFSSSRVQAVLKPEGHEGIKKVLNEFIKHPKQKPFPWRDRKA